MYVNGCFLDAKLDDGGLEGFVLHVSKVTVNGEPIPQDAVIVRGPFKSIYAAQSYAHAWNDEKNPPEIPSPEPVDPMTPKDPAPSQSTVTTPVPDHAPVIDAGEHKGE